MLPVFLLLSLLLVSLFVALVIMIQLTGRGQRSWVERNLRVEQYRVRQEL
jgi:hypothetical protein